MGGALNPACAYHEYLGPAIFVPMARVTLALSAGAGQAVMPEVYANVDMDELVAKITVDYSDDLARNRDGDVLKSPMPTNLAVAYC